MSKHRLPLDSPNWMPLIEVHRFVCEQTGDPRLANRDLMNAMANNSVRSMRRALDFPSRVNQSERELLPPAFWATEYAFDGSSGVLNVFEQRLRPLPPGSDFTSYRLSLSGYVFYVWKPDCKKIFGLRLTLQDTKESAHEKLVKSGRPQIIKWEELRNEIVRRCWQRGRFIPPENRTMLTTELQEWHKRKFKNEPNFDDLRKFVGDAIAILNLAGK